MEVSTEPLPLASTWVTPTGIAEQGEEAPRDEVAGGFARAGNCDFLSSPVVEVPVAGAGGAPSSSLALLGPSLLFTAFAVGGRVFGVVALAIRNAFAGALTGENSEISEAPGERTGTASSKVASDRDVTFPTVGPLEADVPDIDSPARTLSSFGLLVLKSSVTGMDFTFAACGAGATFSSSTADVWTVIAFGGGVDWAGLSCAPTTLSALTL